MAAQNEQNKGAKNDGENFGRFAAITPFHGFAQFMESINWTEQLVWLVFILACIGLTIRDLYLSISDYTNKVTVSTTTMRRNTTIRYSETPICIELDSEHFYFGMDDWSVEDIAALFLNSTETLSIAGFINARNQTAVMVNDKPTNISVNNRDGFNEVLKYFVIDPSKVNWISLNAKAKQLRQITLLTTAMLIRLSGLENGLSNHRAMLENNADNPLPPNEKWIYDFYHNRSVDFRQLTQVTGAWLCVFIEIWIARIKITSKDAYWHHICTRLIERSGVVALGPPPWIESTYPHLCIKAGEFFQFDAKYSKSFIFWVRSDTLYNSSYIHNTANEFPPQIHFQFGQIGAAYHNRTSGSYSMSLGQKSKNFNNSHEIFLHGTFVELKDARESCVNDGDWGSCEAKCAVESFSIFCKCRPLTWSPFFPDINTHLPLCSNPSPVLAGKPYSSALDCQMKIGNRSWWNSTDAESTYGACYAKCKPNCLTNVISLNTIQFDEHAYAVVNNYLDKNDPPRLFYFTVSQYVYPYTEESLKVDLNTLFGNIGGNLGLWIGGSFLAIVHLIVWAVKYCNLKMKGELPPNNRQRRRSVWNMKAQELVLEIWRQRRPNENGKIESDTVQMTPTDGSGVGEIPSFTQDDLKVMSTRLDQLETLFQKLIDQVNELERRTKEQS